MKRNIKSFIGLKITNKDSVQTHALFLHGKYYLSRIYRLCLLKAWHVNDSLHDITFFIEYRSIDLWRPALSSSPACVVPRLTDTTTKKVRFFFRLVASLTHSIWLPPHREVGRCNKRLISTYIDLRIFCSAGMCDLP